MEELYYAYFYDESTRPFRITNLTSYSQPASSNENSLDTLCVEYHLTKEQASKLKINANTSINSLARTEFNELRILDIVSNEYKAADGFIIPKRIFPIPLTTQRKKEKILEDEMRSIVYNGKEVGRTNFFWLTLSNHFIISCMKNKFQIDSLPVYWRVKIKLRLITRQYQKD